MHNQHQFYLAKFVHANKECDSLHTKRSFLNTILNGQFINRQLDPEIAGDLMAE